MSVDLTQCGHIASLILWVGEGAKALQESLGDLAWVDFPVPSEQGKCVAVLEANSDRELIERIDWIKDLPEVLNAQLVYHAFDDETP